MMAHFEVWGLQAMECRGRSRQFISVTNFVSAEEQTILMFPRPAPIPGRASHQVDLEFLLSAFFLLLLLAILFVPRKKKQQKQQKQAKKTKFESQPWRLYSGTFSLPIDVLRPPETMYVLFESVGLDSSEKWNLLVKRRKICSTRRGSGSGYWWQFLCQSYFVT